MPVGADTMRINLHSDAGTFSAENLAIVKQVRATNPPFPVLVGGASAYFYDLQASLRSRLPLAVAIIVICTLVLLFLATGSVILPLKAILMNLLTLSVAFGVLVIVFQWGSAMPCWTSRRPVRSNRPNRSSCLPSSLAYRPTTASSS